MQAAIQATINGTAAPGFESVQQLFEHEMRTMAEHNAQLCVFFRGEKVVDLWSSPIGDGSFSADSLVNVFSSGKSLEAVAIASLVDKGLLSYAAPIAQYWPEFGATGKAGLTVADLMRHEAGLANLDTSMDLEDLFPDNIKRNAVGRIIEQHAVSYPEGTASKREYHAITRGWIANELFRRVDPSGRTIGEFLREEISVPLGADVFIGAKGPELERISRVNTVGFGYELWQGLIPRFLGRRIVHNIFQIVVRMIRIVPGIMKARKDGIPPPLTGMSAGVDTDLFNAQSWSQGETPSANATCSARGLAKVAAMMSGGGRFEGREYIGETAWKSLHDNALEAKMGNLLTTRFTQGGVDSYLPCTPASSRIDREFNVGREGFYGWMGLGGSIFQWHPGLDIGFAFVPTALHLVDLLNERGKRYQAEVLRCAGMLAASGADGAR